MFPEYGEPFTGRKLQKVRDFLEAGGLGYDEGIQFTVNLLDHDFSIAATGSVQDNVLKCLRVDPAYQGEGLTGALLTDLVRYAVERGKNHLFLFTKPGNHLMFSDLGFYEVARTSDVLLMENTRDGIGRFVRSLEVPRTDGVIGSVVCNCNPFTFGHRYLIETAAAQCDLLHVFILSEDKSAFPAADRFEMVRQGVADLQNVVVHPTADYLISSATFPTYFMKDRADADTVNCALDFTIFRDHFAKPLHISRRYVGSEPFCKVTSAYNRQMHAFFANTEIEIVELERRTDGETAISASRVRALLAEDKADQAYALIPDTTRAYLKSEKGQAVIAALQAAES